MKTFTRSILVLACLLSLSLIGLSGCEQAEEAKKAGGELMMETVDKTQQVIGEVTGNTGEYEDEGKKEDTGPAEDEGKKDDAESAEDEG